MKNILSSDDSIKTEKQKTYLLDISYNGYGFNGFQSQPDGNSVQDHIEKNLGVFLRRRIKIKGASRTDSGVHAFGQKAIFRDSSTFDEKRFLIGINALLPDAIGIKSIREVSFNFDPINDSKAKIYRYSLWRGRCFNPFLAPYVWQIPLKSNFTLIEQELKKLEGKHDFTSFCNTDTSAKTKTRNILETKFVKFENSIDVWLLGEGFLKQMIRIIVGTLVDLSLNKGSSGDVKQILISKDRKKAGQTAPSCGLSLVDIFFDDPPKLSSFIEKIEKRTFFYR